MESMIVLRYVSYGIVGEGFVFFSVVPEEFLRRSNYLIRE
jgi:hypothetical protein